MKNMIITAACVILMSMGLLFQADCTRLMQLKHQLKWLGDEGAALIGEASWGDADMTAEDVLQMIEQSSIITDGGGCSAVLNYPDVSLILDMGYAPVTLPFLKKAAQPEYTGHYVYFSDKKEIS